MVELWKASMLISLPNNELVFDKILLFLPSSSNSFPCMVFYRSLVQTNDHLMKEIAEERRRHRHEVEQMHWSYDQLKKTISYLPSTIKGDSTINNNTTNLTSNYRDGDR